MIQLKAVSSDVSQFITHEDDTTVTSTLNNVKDQGSQVQNNKLKNQHDHQLAKRQQTFIKNGKIL